MPYKVLIDPYHFFEPVQKLMSEKYDLLFIKLQDVINKYQIFSDDYTYMPDLDFSDPFFSKYPWIRKNKAILEEILTKSIEKHLKNYDPVIKAIDIGLQAEDISLILLWNDVTPITKAITFLGKKYNIPVLQLCHGIPGPTPVHKKLWADKTAVFGESTRDLYLIQGNPAEKIVITGNPLWDDWKALSKKEDIHKLKKDLKVNSSGKIILYTPTWYQQLRGLAEEDYSLEKRDLHMLISNMERFYGKQEIELLIKIHPGHMKQVPMYEEELKTCKFPYKIFTQSPLLQLIQISDSVIIVGSTTVVVEALLIGKPVIFCIFDWWVPHMVDHDNFFYPHMKKDNTPFYIINNEEELASALNKTLHGITEFSNKDIEEYIHSLNGPCDGKATERVVELAMNMIKSKEKTNFISPVLYKKPQNYYTGINRNIIEMIDGEVARILEIGCREGVMGGFIKNKYGCTCIGVESNIEAASKAKNKMDTVINIDVEKGNLEDYDIKEKSFDYIIYDDILEHLYYPWIALHNHRKFLKDSGYIIATITNIRNFMIIKSLIEGNWTYTNEGTLDSHHLRFFTLKEIKDWFFKCGYEIADIKYTMSNMLDLNNIHDNINIDSGKVIIKNISKEEGREFLSTKFTIKAKKIFSQKIDSSD